MKVPKNKKGIALETAVSLILIIVSLAIVIIILLTTGLITNLQTIICTTLTTGTSWLRGFIIYWIWIFYWILIGVIGALMFLLGSTCKSFPGGTLICIAAYLIFITVVATAFNDMTASIPLIDCPNPTIIRGKCDGEGISNTSFFREVAERTVDCWNMYTAGKYDPLAGREPPNPRTCFVIDFKLNRAQNLNDVIEYMKETNYSSSGVKFIDKVGGAGNIIIKVNKDYGADEQFQCGRLFIKYADDHTFSNWGSEDCWVISKEEDVDKDKVYWCLNTTAYCTDDCSKSRS